LEELVENIKNAECKCKKIYEDATSFCIKQSKDEASNKANIKRQLENALKHALMEVDKYVDKVAEIFESISNTSLRRLCNILRGIQKEHCRGLIPMADILKELPFVYNIIELINNRVDKPPEMYDESSDIKLFENACCIDADEDRCEEECSDENESILKKTIHNNFSAVNLDLIALNTDSTKSTRIKQINSLLKQLNFFTQLQKQKRGELQALYNEVRGGLSVGSIDDVFEEHHTHGWRIKSDAILGKLKEQENAVIKRQKINSTEVTEPELIDDLKTSTYYSTLIKTIIHEISTIESSSDYMSTQCPIQCLCKLHSRDQMIRKCLMTYDSFIDMRKHMYNYIINKMLCTLLKTPEHSKGSDFENYKRDYDAINSELKSKTVDYQSKGKLYAIQKIMNRNFELYYAFYLSLP
jgi:hypothetical protein